MWCAVYAGVFHYQAQILRINVLSASQALLFSKVGRQGQPPSWDYISGPWSSVPKSLLHILCGCRTFSSRTANLFKGLYFDVFQKSMSMGIRSLSVHHRTTLSGNQSSNTSRIQTVQRSRGTDPSSQYRRYSSNLDSPTCKSILWGQRWAAMLRMQDL